MQFHYSISCVLFSLIYSGSGKRDNPESMAKFQLHEIPAYMELIPPLPLVDLVPPGQEPSQEGGDRDPVVN